MRTICTSLLSSLAMLTLQVVYTLNTSSHAPSKRLKTSIPGPPFLFPEQVVRSGKRKPSAAISVCLFLVSLCVRLRKDNSNYNSNALLRWNQRTYYIWQLPTRQSTSIYSFNLEPENFPEAPRMLTPITGLCAARQVFGQMKRNGSLISSTKISGNSNCRIKKYWVW